MKKNMDNNFAFGYQRSTYGNKAQAKHLMNANGKSLICQTPQF